jgi:hypothetical protein
VKPPASNTGRSAAALGLRSAAGTRPGHAQTSDRRLTRPVSGFLAFRRVCDALTCRDAAVCVQIRLSAAERRLYVYGDGFLVTSTLLGIEHSTDQDNAVDEGDDLGLG